jgi:hypothetical protein
MKSSHVCNGRVSTGTVDGAEAGGLATGLLDSLNPRSRGTVITSVVEGFGCERTSISRSRGCAGRFELTIDSRSPNTRHTSEGDERGEAAQDLDLRHDGGGGVYVVLWLWCCL